MKILFVTTISNTLNAFLVPHVKLLVDKGHHVDLACNIGVEIDPSFKAMGCGVHNIPFSRSPLDKANREAYSMIGDLIKEERYDLVHTHTPIASFLTRMASRSLEDTKVVYTAHGFHFHKKSPIKNWLIYYTAEKIASRYTDLIITINHEDYDRALRSFKSPKIEHIPGVGLDLSRYRDVNVNRAEKLRSLNIDENAFIVLSAGELNQNKNHKTIIKAIGELRDENIVYLICGEGPLEAELTQFVVDLKLASQVKLLGERSDLAEIYRIADIFVFPSMREGLGMVALEAMASGLPLVTSNVHGIVDYSKEGKTGYLCDPRDINCFSSKIWELKEDPRKREAMGKYNMEAVTDYSLEKVLDHMEKIYDEVLSKIGES